MFFQAPKEHFESRRGLVTNFGFEHFYPGDTMPSHGFEKVNYFGFEDNIVLESSRRWVRSHRNGPFFAVYLTHTPHHWYGAPRRYGYIEFRAAHSSLYPKERHNDYLNSVRYVDFFIKNVFYQYKRLGVYEDSIFLILGDHGEAFGEHGRNHHDAVPYEEVLKVPLIIHDPQRFQNGIRIEGPVSLLDLPASIADLLGYAIDDGQLAGTSMFALPRKRTLMMSCFEERTCLVRLTTSKNTSIIMKIRRTSSLTYRPTRRSKQTWPEGGARSWRVGVRSFSSGGTESTVCTGVGVPRLDRRLPRPSYLAPR